MNTHCSYNQYQKIEWVHWALQEAINGNTDEAMLTQALELVEDIREIVVTEVMKND
tara:strand:+ start:3645 stop:3812 length:168 start_codon:yes stop_codon:yes gene_type:complete